MADPPHRVCGLHHRPGLRISVETALQHRRQDVARAHAVAPDVVGRVVDGDDPGQAEDRVLSCGVDRQDRVPTDADDGACVHDAAAACIAHRDDRLLASEERPLEVHRDDRIEVILCGFVQVLLDRDGRIVVDDVEAAEFALTPSDCPDYVRLAADVSGLEYRDTARGDSIVRGSPPALGIDVDSDDLRPAGGQRQQHLAAKPASRSCDDACLSLEPGERAARRDGRYLTRHCSSTSSSIRTPSPGPCGTATNPSVTGNFSATSRWLSSVVCTQYSKYSACSRAASTCRLTALMTPVLQEWVTGRLPRASAMAQMRMVSVIPPARVTSGCTTVTPPASMSRSKSGRVDSSSPAAIGTATACASSR